LRWKLCRSIRIRMVWILYWRMSMRVLNSTAIDNNIKYIVKCTI
jgi:hypothetical protein